MCQSLPSDSRVDSTERCTILPYHMSASGSQAWF